MPEHQPTKRLRNKQLKLRRHRFLEEAGIGGYTLGDVVSIVGILDCELVCDCCEDTIEGVTLISAREEECCPQVACAFGFGFGKGLDNRGFADASTAFEPQEAFRAILVVTPDENEVQEGLSRSWVTSRRRVTIR